MPQRFIDTGLFNDPWFSELSNNAKLLWIYYMTNCDNAGFLPYNKKLIAFQLGLEETNTIEILTKELGNRLQRVKEDLLFCPKFITHQYPKGLSDNVKPQKSVLDKLRKNGIDNNIIETLSKPLTNPLQRVQEKEKDIDKDKEVEERENVPRAYTPPPAIVDNLKRMKADWMEHHPAYVWEAAATDNYPSDDKELHRLYQLLTDRLKRLQEDPYFPIDPKKIESEWRRMLREAPPFYQGKALRTWASSFNSIWGEIDKARAPEKAAPQTVGFPKTRSREEV